MRAIKAILSFLFATIAIAAQSRSISTDSSQTTRPKIIAGFGASVCRGAGDHLEEGYIGMLQQRLQKRGWTVRNVSRGGDNTATIRGRWQPTDTPTKRPVADGCYLLPHQPGYVLIGLSLANEGIMDGDADARARVFAQFRSGLLDLITQCRGQGFEVVVANCYPQDKFQAEHYQAIQAMNALIQRWDVASINLLGAVDDGSGHWVDGFARDPGHPARGGHREMSETIPPTLFDALASGKRPATLVTAPGYIQIGSGKGHGLVHQAGDPMRAMTVAISTQTGSSGTLLTMRGKALAARSVEVLYNKQKVLTTELEPTAKAIQFSIMIDGNQLSLLDATGKRHDLGANLEGSDWQQILVSHQPARGVLEIYLNGKQLRSMPARFVTDSIAVGSSNMQLRDFLVYRSFLRFDEVAALHEGTLLRSSLDVYCPLRDEHVAADSNLMNLAQSLASVRVGPAGARSVR